jgi:hypothetical protein
MTPTTRLIHLLNGWKWMVYRMAKELEMCESPKEAPLDLDLDLDLGERADPETRTLALSNRDSQAFAEALLHPRPADERLRATVRAYRNLTGR